jgi:hypothetical protein
MCESGYTKDTLLEKKVEEKCPIWDSCDKEPKMYSVCGASYKDCSDYKQIINNKKI